MPRNTQSPAQKQTKLNDLRFVSCHVCLKTTSEFAQCSINRCKNFYCFECIVEKFNKEFKPENYVKEYWVCYSCGGSCKCQFCRGIDRNRKRRKPKKENHQITESVSGKSEDRNLQKQKEQDPSQAQIHSNAQIQGSKRQITEKKKIYETRRLPIKRNVAFKYKTKRRPKGKNNVDVKSLLQNIKPEDKIFKIKKNEILKDLSNESNEEQSSERQSEVSESAEIQSSKQTQKVKKPGYRQLKKLTEGRRNQRKYEKESNESSSSLDYLERREKPNKKQSDTKKTKPIRKTTRIEPKLQTIKSVDSKKESAIQKQSIEVQGKTIKKLDENSQSQSSSKMQQKSPKNKDSDRRRGSRSRNRGGRRKKIFSMKNQRNSDEQQEEEQESEEKPKRGRGRFKRSDQQNCNQRQKKPITSHQAKQLRDLIQGSSDGPRRRSQRNIAQIEQKNEQKITIKEVKEGQSDQNSIRQQSQSIAHYRSKHKIQVEQSQINSMNEQRSDDHEDELEEQKDMKKKVKKNSMVKKRYQDELQKNMKYQVESSGSQEEEDQPQNDEQNLEAKGQDEAIQSKNIKLNQNQQLQNPQLSNKNQKAIGTMSPEKTSNFTVHVYRKPTHHKKNMSHVSENAQAVTHSNVIANKWKEIEDHHLLDIKNIQKLGMQALFARQNLSKEMNGLMKRRNQLLQKMKNEALVSKEVIDISQN